MKGKVDGKAGRGNTEGEESTILKSLQKHAVINFFAGDRLEQVLGRHIQETHAVQKED